MRKCQLADVKLVNKIYLCYIYCRKIQNKNRDVNKNEKNINFSFNDIIVSS